jgi:hypothetical protein
VRLEKIITKLEFTRSSHSMGACNSRKNDSKVLNSVVQCTLNPLFNVDGEIQIVNDFSIIPVHMDSFLSSVETYYEY